MNNTTKRRSRYKRDSNPVKGRYQHPGDTEIIKLVHEYKYLTRPLLELLTGRKDRSIKRRLRFLFDHQYLAKVQFTRSYQETGSTPDVYVLDTKGRAAYGEHTGLAPDYHRTQLEKRNRDPQLEHTLLINTVRALVTAACERLDDVELCLWKREGKDTRDRVKLTDGKSWPIAPDAFFILRVNDRLQAFFLEADCSTMDMNRMKKKYQAYYNYYQIIRADIKRQKRQKQGKIKLSNRFNVPSFRALTVVADSAGGRDGEERRLASLMQTVLKVNEQGRGWGGFWFAPASRMSLDIPESLLIEQVWQIGFQNGEMTLRDTHSLLE